MKQWLTENVAALVVVAGAIALAAVLTVALGALVVETQYASYFRRSVLLVPQSGSQLQVLSCSLRQHR